MTTCPYCQTVLDGVGTNSSSPSESSETARYVLCPDCHNLVAGSSAH